MHPDVLTGTGHMSRPGQSARAIVSRETIGHKEKVIGGRKK